jgi:hypothetical protein
LPQHNVSMHHFRPVGHQQSLTKAQPALRNLLNCQSNTHVVSQVLPKWFSWETVIARNR